MIIIRLWLGSCWTRWGGVRLVSGWSWWWFGVMRGYKRIRDTQVSRCRHCISCRWPEIRTCYACNTSEVWSISIDNKCVIPLKTSNLKRLILLSDQFWLARWRALSGDSCTARKIQRFTTLFDHYTYFYLQLQIFNKQAAALKMLYIKSTYTLSRCESDRVVPAITGHAWISSRLLRLLMAVRGRTGRHLTGGSLASTCKHRA